MTPLTAARAAIIIKDQTKVPEMIAPLRCPIFTESVAKKTVKKVVVELVRYLLIVGFMYIFYSQIRLKVGRLAGVGIDRYAYK